MPELTSSPPLPLLFGKAALARRHGDTLPDTTYTRHGVPVDPSHLADYARVCGFRLSDTLPATYPHLLTFPLATALLTAPDFPFPLVGLVHVANAITVHRPLLVGDALDLAVRVTDLRAHPKGRQFDVVSEVHAGGELAWSEASTYLRRGGGSGDRPSAGERTEPPQPQAIWRIPEDTGRRYAAVSGDINPIHLHRFSARLLGFRRAIAHGMWTTARCLAALEGRLPAAYTVDVRFQVPILLPGKVGFSESRTARGLDFAVYDTRTPKPHLHGTIS